MSIEARFNRHQPRPSSNSLNSNQINQPLDPALDFAGIAPIIHHRTTTNIAIAPKPSNYYTNHNPTLPYQHHQPPTGILHHALDPRFSQSTQSHPSDQPHQQRSITPINQPSQSGHSRQKRNSSEPATSPRKSIIRIKPPEQIAAEALIEQQNPNATRNQLRSLKLRALHAGRIAERELGMSAEEKARRLRLREYVRQKRIDERDEKLRAQQAERDLDHHTNSQELENSHDSIIDTSLSSDALDPQLFGPTALHPLITGNVIRSTGQFQSNPNHIIQDPTLQTPQRDHRPTNDFTSTHTIGQSHKRKLDSIESSPPDGSGPVAGGSGGPTKRRSTSRIKTSEQILIEAQIERDHPNATKNQLKSLKLRALHADRIAEREIGMSEKEKARRLKLREYMRRRREEERGEPILEPVIIPTRPSGIPVPAQVPAPRTSLSIPCSSSPSMSELNAADRSAAFSIMGLHSSVQSTPVQATTDHNLHLHPLFQSPEPQPLPRLPSSSSPPKVIEDSRLPSFDDHRPIDETQTLSHDPFSLPDVWANLEPRPMNTNGTTTTTNDQMRADELAERALHAAIEQAIFQNHRSEIGLRTNEDAERIRIAEEEILGIERGDRNVVVGGGVDHHHMRSVGVTGADDELALIAAAAAEVERAQLANSHGGHILIKEE